MAKEKQTRKILVAVDGSDRSFKTVKYLTQIDPFRKAKLVLMHVFNGVPESYWDLEREPKSVKSVKYVRAWESEQRKMIQAYMAKARKTLLDAGFSEDRFEVKIQNRKKGIARDIVKEAHAGYDAVLSRRRGMGRIPGIILGSTTIKLLEKLTFVPLLLAGRKPPGKKFLVAFDGSPDAMRAVDFAASLLGGNDFEFCLLNVIRGSEKTNQEHPALLSPERFVQRVQQNIARNFEAAKEKLVARGCSAEKVQTKIITGVRSRAGAIVDEGKRGDYGTIIMGRRGLSRPHDFFMGRVTNKTIHLAKEKSIWVVP
jgi:nucleotide-binding universal stress UspA family protein